MLANLPIMQTHFRIMKGVSERDLAVHTMDEALRARNMDGLGGKTKAVRLHLPLWGCKLTACNFFLDSLQNILESR